MFVNLYVLLIVSLILVMDDNEGSRLHSMLQQVRGTLDNLDTPPSEDGDVRVPPAERTFSTPPQRDTSRVGRRVI